MQILIKVERDAHIKKDANLHRSGTKKLGFSCGNDDFKSTDSPKDKLPFFSFSNICLTIVVQRMSWTWL